MQKRILKVVSISTRLNHVSFKQQFSQKSMILRAPIIEGTGEWKAGEGRVKNLENYKQQMAEAGYEVDDNGVAFRNEQVEKDQQQLEHAEFIKEDHESIRNPETGEWGGYQGKEPTRFGDWEQKGRCTDFE